MPTWLTVVVVVLRVLVMNCERLVVKVMPCPKGVLVYMDAAYFAGDLLHSISLTFWTLYN